MQGAKNILQAMQRGTMGTDEFDKKHELRMLGNHLSLLKSEMILDSRGNIESARRVLQTLTTQNKMFAYFLGKENKANASGQNYYARKGHVGEEFSATEIRDSLEIIAQAAGARINKVFITVHENAPQEQDLEITQQQITEQQKVYREIIDKISHLLMSTNTPMHFSQVKRS